MPWLSVGSRTMKKASIILVFALLVSTIAHAQLRVIGRGNAVGIETSGFPPPMQEAYGLMAQKCSRCHTIERVIVAVQSGVCPLSKTRFTKKTSESIVVRMYLKPESNMTKQEAKTILDLLNFLIDENTAVAGQ